jgi:hypothetical protein
MGRNRRKAGATDADDGTASSFLTYFEYNRVLRTWFVAFGIGGPALFLVNENVARRLAEARELELVVVLFLIGAAAQVLGALTNKVANWYVYLSSVDEAFASTVRYRVAEWLVEQFWIDIVLDVVTIAVFGWAAWLLLTVFVTPG